MMKVSIFVICIYFLKIQYAICSESVVSPNLDEYLANRSQLVLKNVSQKKDIKRDIYKIEIEQLSKDNLEKSKNYSTTTILDTEILIANNKLLYSGNINQTHTIKEIISQANKKDIIYTRVIQYKQLGILVIATTAEMNIYGFNKTNNYYIHTISTPQAVDARLFANNGKLYLIIANARGDNLIRTSIYEFLGTHFDEIETIFTTGAFLINTFSSGTSEIIIILQHVPNRHVFSIVCEFNFGKIRKLQHLHTINPVSIERYVFQNKTYVTIFEKSKINKVYRWNKKASQLIEISEFKTPHVIEKFVTLQVNGLTAMVVPLVDRLQVYIAHVKGLNLEKEEPYNSTYSNILDTLVGLNNTIIVIALSEYNQITMLTIRFNIHIEKHYESEGNNKLRSCINDLELKVYNKQKVLREFSNLIKARNNTKNSTENDTKTIQRTAEEEPDIETSLEEVWEQIRKIEPLLNTYKAMEEDNITINGSVIINGLLEADKLSGKNINVKKINSHKWTPEQWLMYKEPQTITGPVTIQDVIAKELITSKDDLFTNLFLKNGNQEILGKVTIKDLTTDEIFAKQINDLLLEDVYLKSNPELIKGLKTFQNLNATEAKINLLNKKAPDHVLSLFTNTTSRIVLSPQLEIENLLVEWIDGVHWDSFKQSVFRIGKTAEINGNLTFPEIRTENLNLKTLNGVNVLDFLTTSTDQIIESDIQFNRIFAENITTNTTNNIKLSNAVRFGDDRPVEGPVQFDKLYVRKNLELIGKLDKDFFLRNGNRIIGTNESDFLQTYQGKVRIKGNLYLSNITLQPESHLLVSQDEVNANISDLYWTKSTKQVIPVRFQAQKGLTAPHLLTEMINNIKTSQYMLNDNEDKLQTSFHFTNVSIAGDVILNSGAKHIPNLNKINEKAVKITGRFNLTGKKTYTDTLRIKHLATDMLDGINVSDAITKTWSGAVPGHKTFENVIVKGNLVADLQSVKLINDVDLKQLTKHAIYVDQPQDLNRLHFKNITVSNLYVSTLNDHQMDEYILKLEKFYSSDKINNLNIEGDVRLNDVKNISTINHIKFKDLRENALKVGSSGAVMLDLEFLGHLKVDNLIATHINNVNLNNLTGRVLKRNVKQTVTAPFSFTKLKAKNVVAPRINDISIKNLVDVASDKDQILYVPNDIEFSSAKLTKSLQTNETSPCDMEEALKKINDPPTQDWHTVEIKGNATLMDTENIIYRVFDKAVTTNYENIIRAPVNFSNHILAENVVSKSNINGVNLEEIMHDAVLVDSQEVQVITGYKTFPTIQAPSARVRKNVDSPVVNDIDIPELNRKLVRKNDIPHGVIRGTKTFFGGLDTDRFYSDKVGNTDTDNIVNLQNLKKIPNAIFDSIEVENNLNVTRVNRMPFSEILQKRLLTDKLDDQITNGLYYFDNIEVENMETPSINKIDIDDVVFDVDQQDIFSGKRFLEPVEIYGNVQSDYINEVDITRTHEKSVIAGENVTVDGSIIVLRPSVVKGNIYAESINGYPITNITDIIYKGAAKAEVQKVYSMKSDIAQMVTRNLKQAQIMPSDYMYLEKSDVLQISVQNTVSAKTMKSKGYVLIHITGEESGEYCGLPNACKCPVQYSMEITPEHSVSVFPNKGLQRTFSYSDENMIIHFKTNSISTDSTCRSNKARVLNEVSMMSWSTLPTENTTGAFYQYHKLITGYISAAEFFTLNGKSYAIIGRYYDPTADTHNLDCIVIKFSDDQSKAEEIQSISTRGVWSVYLFHTAQGVTLIVGNLGNSSTNFEEEETVIYRFNENNQKFEILMVIPSYGSLMATGVVLGVDSLIVLAHNSAPPQILKYNQYYDNYYFYQSFELESPIQGISVFYTGGFGISDAYLCIVTKNENYFIYSFQFIEGWKLESSGELEGLKNLIPFELNNQPYLFAPSTKISSLLTVVKHGSV